MEPQSNCAVFSFSVCQLRLQVGPWEPDMKMHSTHPPPMCTACKPLDCWPLISLRGHREEDSPHIHPTPWIALRSGSLLLSSRIDAILAPFMSSDPLLQHTGSLGDFFFSTNFHHGFFFPTLFFQTLKGFDSSRFISKHLKERRPAGR